MSLPERLGRLRRVRRLGAGGFASVWLYHDDELDSDVAVKALADNWAQDPAIRERFLAESRLLRRAESDHLVHVHDIGVTEDDTPYFVMSYADQGSVHDLLTGSVLPRPSEVVDIVEQAAKGLTALHEHGIVHRDIKPQNLLLATRPNGTRKVLVADLGVAKAITTSSGVTLHVGTPSYAAPEQSDPDTALDPRADVHGLGAVAYALISGQPPRSHVGPPTPLSQLVPGLPPAVEHAVMTALEPDRDRRWPDAMSFANALQTAVKGTSLPLPVPVRAPSPTPTPSGATGADATSGAPTPTPTPVPFSPSGASGTPPSGSRRPRWLLPTGIVATIATIALGITAVMLVLDEDETPQGGKDGKGAPAAVSEFEQAGVDYVSALQSGDCEEELSHVPADKQGTPVSRLCSDKFNHFQLAQCIDLDEGAPRVEEITHTVTRVIFEDQGYVELVRTPEDDLQVNYMVACLNE